MGIKPVTVSPHRDWYLRPSMPEWRDNAIRTIAHWSLIIF